MRNLSWFKANRILGTGHAISSKGICRSKDVIAEEMCRKFQLSKQEKTGCRGPAVWLVFRGVIGLCDNPFNKVTKLEKGCLSDAFWPFPRQQTVKLPVKMSPGTGKKLPTLENHHTHLLLSADKQ